MFARLFLSVALVSAVGCGNAQPKAAPNQAAKCQKDLWNILGEISRPTSVQDLTREVGDEEYAQVRELLRCDPTMRDRINAKFADHQISLEEFEGLKMEMINRDASRELEDANRKREAVKAALDRDLGRGR